jgi:glycosyltransferase involved in cell wall biosynthesis
MQNYKATTSFKTEFKDKLACAIVTLNEEKNIIDCIDSIREVGDFEIRVYDGGSTDNTVSIARKMGALVIENPGTSLSYRRQLAADELNSKYIFYVNADQRINSLKGELDNILTKYFDSPSVAGIMFRTKSDQKNYWANGFYWQGELFFNNVVNPKIIGMPCVFRTQLVKDVRFGEPSGSIDDTMLCSRLAGSGYTFKITESSVIKKYRATFKLTLKKAFWYGLGDAEFVKINSGRLRRNHVFHVLVRHLFINPCISLIRKPLCLPFFISFGAVRAIGFGWGLIYSFDLSSLKS